MATVAVFTMIPIWNDLWFPLILAPAEATKTITLGTQFFIGQFVTNWNAVLAALTAAGTSIALPGLGLVIAGPLAAAAAGAGAGAATGGLLGALIGWGLDALLGTMPLFLLLLMFFGFGVGVRNVIRISKTPPGTPPGQQS